MIRRNQGFTLIELLVVIAIITVLIAIMAPAMVQVRNQAKQVLGASYQRKIVGGVTNYAMDHQDFYPDSVATIGLESSYWNWQEPTMMAGYRQRAPRLHRTLSAYLHRYIPQAETMFCPNGPQRYASLEEAWQAGEDWDHPLTPPRRDPVVGTYCFYWGYIGYLRDADHPFRGPRSMTGGAHQSTLLVSDYYGYDHWRSPGAYGSCERLEGGGITDASLISAAYWSWERSLDAPEQMPPVKLYAGYTDGHVEHYHPADTVAMEVATDSEGLEPYPMGVGPGIYFLPEDGRHR